jgi:hypothetical protein
LVLQGGPVISFLVGVLADDQLSVEELKDMFDKPLFYVRTFAGLLCRILLLFLLC